MYRWGMCGKSIREVSLSVVSKSVTTTTSSWLRFAFDSKHSTIPHNVRRMFSLGKRWNVAVSGSMTKFPSIRRENTKKFCFVQLTWFTHLQQRSLIDRSILYSSFQFQMYSDKRIDVWNRLQNVSWFIDFSLLFPCCSSLDKLRRTRKEKKLTNRKSTFHRFFSSSFESFLWNFF